MTGFAVVLLGTVLPAGPASSEGIQTLAPEADAYVSSASPAVNFGSAQRLFVDSSPTVLHTYLRFTVPPGTDPVTDATLRLYVVDASTNGGSLYRVADNAWGEGTITYNLRPTPAGAIAPIGAVALDTWVELDVASYVTGPGTYSFAITTPSQNGSDYVSREGQADRRPQLVVDTTPPPPPPPIQTLAPEADAYVSSASPAVNFGSAQRLFVDSSPTVLHTYLRFTVPPGTDPVTDATLRLYVVDASTNGGSLYRVADNAWGEGTITYNLRPTPAGAIAPIGAVALDTWVELDVASYVTGPGTYSFAITTPSQNGSDYVSREGQADRRPQLVVHRTVVQPDTEPPTVPHDLQGSATGPTTVQMSWQPSTDDRGVLGYTVYRDNLSVGAPADPTFLDLAALPATTHIYEVEAVDAAGNVSARSAPLSVTTPGLPPIQTLAPEADAYVSSASPAVNFGSAQRLFVDSSPTVLHTYLRFTVPPGTDPVTDATLRLYVVDASTNGGSLYRVADNAWGEGTITYNLRPTPAGAIAPIGAVTLDTWVELDVASYVTGPGTYSFAITTPSQNGSDYVSREGQADRRPQLVVDTTPPPPPTDDLVVAAAGDISCTTADPAYNGGNGTATACRMRATSDLLLAPDIDAVLPLGDLQYEAGSLAQFQSSYDLTWGRVMAISHPVPGNHEYGTPGASGYYAYFGARAGDPSKGYYSFDVGQWHFIALNSNCANIGGCGAGSPQEQWLRADLAANPANCTLAYWHHPRFSSRSGSDPAYIAFWNALYGAGAEVVLVGHSHNYERFAPQDAQGVLDAAAGIREFVVGTGGRNLAPFNTVLANSEVRRGDTFGVLRLTLRDDGYDWRFEPEAGRTFTDTGSSDCH